MKSVTHEHLKMWTRDSGSDAFRVDLWDTGVVDGGKHRLRYAFVIIPDDLDVRPIVFEGEDFWPSPMLPLDADDTAAALLSFFAHYGECLIAGDDEVPEFTWRQSTALIAYHDDIALWSHELDPHD